MASESTPEPSQVSDDEYQAYLARFEAAVGPCEPGSYAKFRGRLIKKLKPDEFPAHWKEYQAAMETYAAIMERGDTINDVVARVLKERCDELVIDQAF
jgi:hypothetical protein